MYKRLEEAVTGKMMEKQKLKKSKHSHWKNINTY